MAKGTKLRSMLHRHQGRNIPLEKQRKHEKSVHKKREAANPAPDSDEESESGAEDVNGDALSQSEDEEEINGDHGGVALGDAGADSSDDEDADQWEDDDDDSGEEADLAARLDDSDLSSSEEETDDAQGAEDEEEDIPLSDLESVASDDRGDIIPHQRLTINNKPALLAALHRFQLPALSHPFSAFPSITTDEPVEIADVDDDLSRELAFYKQCLSAAICGRALLKKENVPFTRPTDYFAEMVKSDEHMGKIKQKLTDEAASKKAASDARRQRDLKKFGKQVQVAKLQERQKEKRDTLEKINVLKRKRSNAPISGETEGGNDLFDIALDDADNKADRRQSRRAQGGPAPSGQQSNRKRQKKNDKYGFGGKKRHAKSGDAMSSADMRDHPGAKRMKQNSFGGRGGAGGKKRPGKSKRMKARL